MGQVIAHNHFMARIEATSITPDGSKAAKYLEECLGGLCVAIGMKVCISPRSNYVITEGNEGITAQLGLETSHIALHEWVNPDRVIMQSAAPHLVQFDLYTCGCLAFEQRSSINTFLLAYYQPLHYTFKIIDRSLGL